MGGVGDGSDVHSAFLRTVSWTVLKPTLALVSGSQLDCNGGEIRAVSQM